MIWVTGSMDDVVARLDPRDGQPSQIIHVGRGASGVAVGAGAVWVASALDHEVSRIDPAPGGRRTDPDRRLSARDHGRCGEASG